MCFLTSGALSEICVQISFARHASSADSLAACIWSKSELRSGSTYYQRPKNTPAWEAWSLRGGDVDVFQKKRIRKFVPDSRCWTKAHQRRSRKVAASALFNRVLTLSKAEPERDPGPLLLTCSQLVFSCRVVEDSYFCEHSLWLPWTHRGASFSASQRRGSLCICLGTMGALTDSELLAACLPFLKGDSSEQARKVLAVLAFQSSKLFEAS